MSGWSLEDAIAMERRHVLSGDKAVARQEALVKQLIGKGRDQLAQSADEVLGILCTSRNLSRNHLIRLEALLGDPPKSD
jgi:hypothetical protein